MSSSQKVVKIVSFVLFALGILDLVGAGFMIAGVGLTNGDTQGTAAMVAIMFFIMTAFNIVFAALGIRGANNPRNIGGFRVMAVFALAFDVLNIASSAMTNPGALAQPASFVVYLSLAVTLVGFVKSGDVKKIAEK